MTRHYLGDYDKLVEETAIGNLVDRTLLRLTAFKQEEVRQVGYRCLQAMKPMRVDDPARLPTVSLQDDPNKKWVRLYRYCKASKELVLSWWEYKRGSLPALDVVVRASVLNWMTDNDYKLYDIKTEVPCELPKF